MTSANKDGSATESDEDAGSSEREPRLQEGLDYYLENGLFVFTAAFLRKRGYCCDSGCRHLYSIIRSVH
ncbi:MAG TPA: DUF5522 domain-containing protein [Pyrinomonadaceae bacterium]|jgi:hypothetical protein|nr:DUF5522 domain-containing protein [Pyrinomonadaceae bacterium]